MQNNNNERKNIIVHSNLLGDKVHHEFLGLQALYAIEKRGGSFLSGLTEKHASRLVNDLNLLSSSETRELIFSNHFLNTLS